MASFEFSEAQKLQNPLLQSEILNSIITVDDVMKTGIMPFVDTSGAIVISYNRINSYGSTRATAVAGTGSVTHSAATFSNVTGRIMTYASQVRIPRVYAADAVFVASQLQAKAHDVGLAFSTDLGLSAAATDTTLKVPGYGALCLEAQSTSASDSAITGVLSFAALDAVADLVKEVGPKGFIMPAKTIRSYRALCRTAGVSPEMIGLANWGLPQLAHNGIPIFKNEFLATDIVQGGAASVNTSTIYCAMFDPVRGVHGFFASGPGVLQVVGPYEVTATVSEEYSIEFNVGVALKSNYALAKLVGISN